MCSKIPKCEQKEKLAKCKITNSIPLKTKYPSLVEDTRVEGNDFNSLKAGNTRNLLPSSKVPIRSNSKASGQSPCNATNQEKKSNTKNKGLIKNNKVENGSILSKEAILNSHFSKKNSCGIKANNVSQHNTIINTLKPHFPDKKNMHGNHTIQIKRMVSNKGILRGNCHNSGSLKNASESDINLNSQSKNSRKDRSSNTRKVRFKTSSSNDLSKLSDDDVNLMDAMDKERPAYKIDNNNIFSPKKNYKTGDKQIFNGCLSANDNKEPKNLSILADIEDDTLMSMSENNDNFQKENTKFHNSNFLDSPLKNETLNSEEVTTSSKNIYSGEEKCPLLPSETVTLKKILQDDEIPDEKKLERRQSIQKQIDEKVEILTAEFLKYIKENKKRNPRSVISKKAKSKNVIGEGNIPQELCLKDECSLQDIEMNIKSNTDKNDINYNREISYNLPLNGEVREEKTLINNVKEGLLDSHHLTELRLDLKISPVTSRIPQATSYKKKSLTPIVPSNLNSDINIHEKRIPFSPTIGKKLGETENNSMKYSPKQNLSKDEIDKTVSLRKEFDSITNVCKRDFHEEVQLENNKVACPREKFKNRNSENSLAGEDCENSRHIHITEKYKDMKKMNNGAKPTKKNLKCITNFKNQSGDFIEKPEGNISHVPSNNIISLEGDIENRLKTYLPLENKTHSSDSSGEESGNENIIRYEDKENIKCDSSSKVLFSNMTKIACFTLIFVVSTLLFISVFV